MLKRIMGKRKEKPDTQAATLEAKLLAVQGELADAEAECKRLEGEVAEHKRLANLADANWTGLNASVAETDRQLREAREGWARCDVAQAEWHQKFADSDNRADRLKGWLTTVIVIAVIGWLVAAFT